jgi:outer membrane protein, heavy metal efflux system
MLTRKNIFDKRLLHTGVIAFIAILISVAGQLYAQPVSLGELFDYALGNNPEIGALRNSIEAKKQDVRTAAVLPDPSFSAGYFISSVETRVGPQKGKIGASQMLPWPGKLRDKKRIAQKELSATIEELNDRSAVLLSDITETYAALFAIGKTIAINSENLNLLKQMESLLLAKYSTTNTTQMSLLKLQVAMAVLEDEIKSLASEAKKEREKLIALLGGMYTKQIDFPQNLPDITVSIDESLLDSALNSSNPKLRNLSFLKSAASEKVNLSQKKYIPNFMLMTDYIFTDATNSSMVSADENGKNPWIITASINVPIWFRANNAKISKMKNMESAVTEKEKNMHNILHAKIMELHESYRDVDRKIELFETILIPKAKQSLSLFEEAYTNNNASILDFLDAQRMLLDLEIKLARQKAMRIKLAGKIDMIFGGKELIALSNK